jgi:hypothetical protein
LLAQTENAISIFENKTHGFATGLFMFDNAPSHLKRAPDALSARKMPKKPNDGWTHSSNGPKMRPGLLPNGNPQDLYFLSNHPKWPGWFKGTEVILRERGLYPQNGLRAACEKACFGSETTSCCCRKVLYCQPDFVNQKSALQELVESRGHICDFYPKFHCELNFIEQYWGAAKWRYRNTPPTASYQEMQANVIKCLDDVPQGQIQR